jgi:hypothetical protein
MAIKQITAVIKTLLLFIPAEAAQIRADMATTSLILNITQKQDCTIVTNLVQSTLMK